jgi:hypothetical protein
LPDFDLILHAKTKQIQIKLLVFPWIPLADSGLFNGLQRIQIKNFVSLAHSSLAALNWGRFMSSNPNIIAELQLFKKQMFKKFAGPADRAVGAPTGAVVMASSPARSLRPTRVAMTTGDSTQRCTPRFCVDRLVIHLNFHSLSAVFAPFSHGFRPLSWYDNRSISHARIRHEKPPVAARTASRRSDPGQRLQAR